MKTTFTLSRVAMLIGILLSSISLLKADACSDGDVFSINCPADVWASCYDELWDLSIYGNANYHDYNGTHDAGYPTVTYNLNSCNVGTIYRTWTVEDYNWVQHSCTQVIHVGLGNYGFTEYNITWPSPEIELEGCYPSTDPYSANSVTGKPTYTYAQCSNVGASYSDQQFDFSATCKKIVRTWKVIDWCQYNPNGTYSSANGYYTFIQIIKIVKDGVPVLDCPADVVANASSCDDGTVQLDPLTVLEGSCGSYFTITNNSPYAFDNGADISGIYPVGTTKVKYSVNYGCNFYKTCYVYVTVEDTKGPVPYCLGEVIVPLMGMDTDNDGVNDEGMVSIWAKDFDFGSYSPCGNGPVTFSFERDSLVMNRTFTCDHVGDNELKIYVKDSKGNVDFCTVTLSVQNNGANIQDCIRIEDEPDVTNPTDTTYHSGHRIAGVVNDLFDNELSDVEISNMMSKEEMEIIINSDTSLVTYYDTIITSSGTLLFHEWYDSTIVTTIDTVMNYDMDMSYEMTSTDGSFSFDDIEENMDYQLSAKYGDVSGTGINAQDAIRLMDHILEEELITDPLILLAADVDDSGSVNVTDLLILIDYVKGRIDFLPTTKPWVIIDASYDFGSEMTPESVEEATTINLLELAESIEEMNFIAIQKGDLTNTLNNNINGKLNAMESYFAQEQNTEEFTQIQPSLELETISSKSIMSIEDVSVYPNPFREDFQISFMNNTAQMAGVSLFDLSGKLIMKSSKFLGDGPQTIRVRPEQNLESGVYMYQLVLGNQTLQGKLIKF